MSYKETFVQKYCTLLILVWLLWLMSLSIVGCINTCVDISMEKSIVAWLFPSNINSKCIQRYCMPFRQWSMWYGEQSIDWGGGTCHVPRTVRFVEKTTGHDQHRRETEGKRESVVVWLTCWQPAGLCLCIHSTHTDTHTHTMWGLTAPANTARGWQNVTNTASSIFNTQHSQFPCLQNLRATHFCQRVPDFCARINCASKQ